MIRAIVAPAGEYPKHAVSDRKGRTYLCFLRLISAILIL
jgi:hypothetical protein